MSIENHKWVDPNIEFVEANQKTIQIEHECPSSSVIEIHKKDSLAIARHFGQDDDLLVLKLEGFIAEYKVAISHLWHKDGFYIGVKNVIRNLEKLTGESN